jgi:drug/metabolite transporter (DMT)-like permease
MSDNIPENIPEQIPGQIPDPAAPSSEQVALQEQPVISEPIAPTAVATYEQETRSSSARSVFIAIAGWVVPGLGHLFQRRIGRAMAGFAAVGTMAVIGLWMRGNVFPVHSDDAFGLLGFIADAGSGIFYLLAHTIEKAGPDVSRAAGDYGTRLIATAGVLNMLFVLDALEISRGHKN